MALRLVDRQAPYRVQPSARLTLADLQRRLDDLTRRHETLGARLTGQADPHWLTCVQVVTDALNLAEHDLTETDLALTGGDPDRAVRRHTRAGENLQRALDALTEWEADYGG